MIYLPTGFYLVLIILRQVQMPISVTVFGAQDALAHISSLELEINHILSANSLLDKSVLLVGFDETAVAQGWGLLQRVYLVSSIELDELVIISDQLGKHFSPYPGTIITPTRVQPTPVYHKDGGYYKREELIATQTERFDSVTKDRCLILSEGCKLHFSQVQVPIGNTFEQRPNSATLACQIPSAGGGPGEESEMGPNDGSTDIPGIILRHGDEPGGEDMDISPTDVSQTSEHHNVNVPPTSGGGELPPPSKTNNDSPHSVYFNVKTDIYLDPPNMGTNGTQTGVTAYQNIIVDGLVVYEVGCYLFSFPLLFPLLISRNSQNIQH